MAKGLFRERNSRDSNVGRGEVYRNYVMQLKSHISWIR